MRVGSPRFAGNSRMGELLLTAQCSFVLTVKSSAASSSVFGTLPIATIAMGVNATSRDTHCGLPMRASALPFLRQLASRNVIGTTLGDNLGKRLSSTVSFFGQVVGRWRCGGVAVSGLGCNMVNGYYATTLVSRGKDVR